jgi:hypothetical protein
MKIAGSGSGARSGAGLGPGSVSHRYGSPDPDQYQNFTDPQHWYKASQCLEKGLIFL